MRKHIPFKTASQSRELVCLSEDGEKEFRFPSKGLTRTELMDGLNPLLTLPEHQLQLPFSITAWREAMTATKMCGTTLQDNPEIYSV